MDNINALKYAGFWIRLRAYVIDSILAVLLIFSTLAAIYYFTLFQGSYTDLLDGVLLGEMVGWVAPAIITIAFWVFKQATPGKMLLGIKVIDAKSGGPPSLAQCIGRYFAYFLSLTPLAIGFFWVAFDGRKQGWHDKLSGTLVVYCNKDAVVP